MGIPRLTAVPEERAASPLPFEPRIVAGFPDLREAFVSTIYAVGGD